MPKISLIFRCLKELIVIWWKFANMQKSADFCKWRKFEKLISIEIWFYPNMPKINLIFRCPKGLIAILSKFANMPESADFCKWQEIWEAHINLNVFLPYHAKNQPHFQVSKRTYSHFMEICKWWEIWKPHIN